MRAIRLIILMIFSISLTACGGGSDKKVEHKSGKLLSSKLVADYPKDAVQIDGIETKYAVNAYRIIYETKNQQGEYIHVSGLLSIPQKNAGAKSPMLLNHHGTQYENREAPSVNVHKASNFVFPAYIGFITVAPDYIGYGESLAEEHPYLITKLTASTSIDLLRASRTFLQQQKIATNKQLFLGGYSQGGAAVLASQKMLEEEMANEFTVTASSAGAGGYALGDDLLETSQDIVDNYDNYKIKRPSNIGLIFKSMDSTYSLNMLDRIFQPDYVGVVNSIYDRSHDSAYIDSKLSHDANKLLKKSFLLDLLSGKEDKLLEAFEANDIFDWKPKAPTLLYHGKEDDWVKFSHAQTAYDIMLSNGATKVQLVECVVGGNLPANHGNCFGPYLLKSYDFFSQYVTDL